MISWGGMYFQEVGSWARENVMGRLDAVILLPFDAISCSSAHILSPGRDMQLVVWVNNRSDTELMLWLG